LWDGMHLNIIRERLKKLSIALAMCMALSLAVTPAMAVVTYTPTPGNGYIEFVGAGQINTATNYTIYVEHPFALGLDADYWNMTVYSVHGAGLGTSHIAYYVHVHIYDGATNLTKNVTVSAVDDAVVYSNVSHAAAAYAALVENDTAKYTVELYLSTGTPLASYVGEVAIYSSELTASMVNVMMLIIPMVILVAIIGWVGNLTGKIGGKSRRK
jgi:hypothetical protein